MSDIVAIDRVRRVWNKIFCDYPTATKKFEAAKERAMDDYPSCESVTADEFFKYLKEIKQLRRMENRNRRHAINPNGDFDDMGMEEYAASYHYNQKKLRGRL